MNTKAEEQVNLQNSMEFDKEVLAVRRPQTEVSPIFANRWSTRAFMNKEVTESQLNTLIEAASYAPSAFNHQPWRFFVAATEEQKAMFESFFMPRNLLWAKKASAYILLASESLTPDGGTNNTHTFDAGAAWASLALQAKMLGLTTRAFGGFERDKARELLSIPESIIPHVVIAVGYAGTEADLDESFHAINAPSPRKSLDQLIVKY